MPVAWVRSVCIGWLCASGAGAVCSFLLMGRCSGFVPLCGLSADRCGEWVRSCIFGCCGGGKAGVAASFRRNGHGGWIDRWLRSSSDERLGSFLTFDVEVL